MNSTITSVGLGVLILYVAFRCVIFFSEKLWNRSQDGIYQLTRDTFQKLREENRLKLVESLLMELTPSEQRGLALNYVMLVTGYPDPESFENIRQEVEQRREAQHLRVYGRAMTQKDRDMDAFAASMDEADARRENRRT
jgi:hypothetical protein